ncbi:NAD(+) diphosphatase [Sneathiella glossodoripedis]|uniref:NAD(+) diphosphatase n=1 Tax=Sneathiella glossodoripedis TaxID=418853 RepID=UPI000A054A0B
MDVRNISSQLRPGEAGALAQARSLLAWHETHQFCAKCGSKTESAELGYSRKCCNDQCNATHFPRTDPVVIMMVVKGDNCLLGTGHHFPKQQYSALAGFIEPGETIEQGVRREVFEETGVRTGEVTYHSSQPWPYPSSLMIGCFAEALSEEITLEEAELADARWFSKAEVRKMLARSGTSETPRMSPPMAIAHQLAKSWVED